MRTLSRAAGALLALAFLVCAAPAWAWQARPATYGVAKQQNVPITMSDGTVLYADVLRPAQPDGAPAPGRFPVLLTQTPYNKAATGLNFENDYLVERGYVQVIADVRGTGNSQGEWDSFGAREQRDGYELAVWAASKARPWSDGDLGLYGASYGAINQLFTAAQHPPGLKAEFPIVPGADSYRDITGSGGQLDTSFIPSWLGLVTTLGLLPPSYTGSDPITAAQTLADHSDGLLSFQGSTLVESSTGGDTAYDGPFYRTRSPIEVIDRVRVPTFIVGGWWDLFQRGEPMLYEHLRRNGVPTRLLMGPWYHLTASSGAGLPVDGVPTEDDLALRWFDHYLMGRSDPALDTDISPVTYYELGQGHYQHASDYPFPDVGYEQLALSGPASPGSPGKLVPNGTGSGSPDSVPWSPASGVCTRSTVQWTAGAGSSTPCETDDRANDTTAVSYDFKPASPLQIGGPIAARLFVSTSAKDGLVAARVEDVAPDGTATQLTAGWQVLSLRALDESKTVSQDGFVVQPYHPFTKESKLAVTPGQPMEVEVEIFPTDALFAAGHTLRLTIQSADAPHLTPPVPQALDSLGGTIQIWHDATHQSQLVIPIRGAARPAAPRTHACAARHRLTVRVRQPRHGRVVRVEAFVNGKLARRARGRRITRVRLGHLPRGRLHVRLVERTSSGRRIVTRRSYSGCARRG